MEDSNFQFGNSASGYEIRLALNSRRRPGSKWPELDALVDAALAVATIEEQQRLLKIVVIRHAIKNALIPVVSLIGLQLPILVGGAVIMENIFNLPGLGRLLLLALQDRDYPVVSGVNLFFAAGVMGINLLIDLIYPYLDPRVRYE